MSGPKNIFWHMVCEKKWYRFSEQKIQNALSHLMEGRTTLTIAHRLATVRKADVIYVLEEGLVTAHGTHQELLKTSPRYQQLSKMQFQGQPHETV